MTDTPAKKAPGGAAPHRMPPRPGKPARPAKRSGPSGVEKLRSSLKRRMARPGARGELRPSAPIVPSQAVAGRALTLVVAIMSFLACLTVGAVTIIHEAANAWSNDLVREVTIQIRPADGVDMLREIEKAIAVAREFPGVGAVRALSDEETKDLLQPWLGAGLDLESLPVPRLIQVNIADASILDLAGLRQAVVEQVNGASLDDHSLWTDRLAAMANAVVFGGVAILALVLGSMVLSVVFATRAAMAGNRDVVEVLHFVGAEDGFVAREFQRHFLLLGLKGGLAGGLAACAVFLVLGVLADGSTGLAGMEQAVVLFGGVSVGLAGYLGVLAVIFLVTVLTAATSRVAVHAHLRRIE
ncbi:ABC transporter permease [Stappia taiwanensis]|uniref:ABC transporter permease n=2 Tax=Stappia taiwanensis TaxID=992267 RepID=A0A838XP69_9HYPH|nr:ABC transporter permease [Stappia taiwanensis]